MEDNQENCAAGGYILHEELSNGRVNEIENVRNLQHQPKDPPDQALTPMSEIEERDNEQIATHCKVNEIVQSSNQQIIQDESHCEPEIQTLLQSDQIQTNVKFYLPQTSQTLPDENISPTASQDAPQYPSQQLQQETNQQECSQTSQCATQDSKEQPQQETNQQESSQTSQCAPQDHSQQPQGETNQQDGSQTLDKSHLTSNSSSQFDIEDHCGLRLRKMNDSVSCKTMLKILTWGTQNTKPSHMTFEDYFITEKNMTKKNYKNLFNKDQRDKLGSDLTGESFDITLLLVCIKHACDGIERSNSAAWMQGNETLESALSSVKAFRNNLMHDESRTPIAECIKKAETLRDDLERALRYAGEKYSIDSHLIEKEVDEMNEFVNSIRDQPVAVFDITNYDNALIYADRKNILLTSGKEEIIKTHRKLCHFNPVSFITGKQFNVDVGTIFTKMEIVNENTDSDDELSYESVEYENILVFGGKSQRDSSKVMLVEGPAGSGKSTLTRKMVGDWIAGDSTMLDLISFDLLLYMECRDATNHTFLQLLESAMPKTAKRFNDSDLMKCVLSLRLLIIVDGLDEMNRSSSSLFKDILSLKAKNDLFLFCTTRPEKIEDCYKLIPSGEEITHLRILGIPDNRRQEFACNYHDQLRTLGISKQETRGLKEYIRTDGANLIEHWRLPLNLVLLTVLWSVAPKKVNCVTTATELYFEIFKLTVEKLLERLKLKEQTQHVSVRILQRRIEMFVLKLCSVALYGLKNDEIILSDESLSNLENICCQADLPEEESLGAFLVHKNMWAPTGVQYKISYPHKGIQDFLSALCMLLKLKQMGIDLDIKELIRTDLDILQSEIQYSARRKTGLSRRASLATQCQTKIKTETSRITGRFIRPFRFLYKRFFNARTRPEVTPTRIRTGRTPTLQRMKRWVSEPILMFLNADSRPSIAITEMLSELYPENIRKINYPKFNNAFVHLIGLLHITNGNNIKRGLVEELVRTLQLSGIKKKEEWLDLISNVKCDVIVADVIADLIPSLTQADTLITDTRVYSYVSLFQKKCPISVTVDITSNPKDIPHLEELFSLLRTHESEVISMDFHDEFQYPVDVKSNMDETLKELFVKGQVKNYRGVLNSRLGSSMPPDLQRLRVGIGSHEQYVKLYEMLTSSTTNRSLLKRLVIHMSHGIDDTNLSPLPRGMNVHLYLSDVGPGDIDWACRIALGIQPETAAQGRGYASILFPRCKLEICDFENLLEAFGKAGIHVSRAICTSANIPFDKVQDMQNLAQMHLRVDFVLIPEVDIWKKW